MAVYEDRLFPRLLDWVMNNHVMDRQRAKVVPHAQGVVLEIGSGTGLNWPFYDVRRIGKLLAIEPSASLRARGERRLQSHAIKVEVHQGVAERLPMADGTVDSVVLTYTLCSVQDPETSLSEILRVLKPGGRLLVSEHGRAPDPSVLRLQRLANPVWSALACGCCLHRDMEGLIRSAGFDSCALTSAYLPGPRVFGFTTWGHAIKA
jgi:ubiquinone/menaquinone biosynthesis C-methylase UbiE